MRHDALLTTALAFLALLAALSAPASAQPAPQLAPSADRPEAADGAGRAGFVPPGHDLSHVVLPAAAAARSLPARHDARDLGLVSSVKNQGACGSCYAFAAAADLESAVLATFGVERDLAENHLKECHFEARSCDGGNAGMVMNLATRSGAVQETCDPYVPADVACETGCDPAFSVRGWRWLQGSALPDVAALKQALLDRGPISTTVFAGDASTPAWQAAFNGWSGGPGLHYAGPETSNHAVLLVGWDDDQPHAGGGQGCWIVKNSWGAAWGSDCGSGGEGGYFYIAYGSAGIGTYSSVVTDVMSAYPELTVTGWDDGGWTNEYGYGSTIAWALARFDPTEDTRLHRVELWTTDAGADIDVHVYDTFAGGVLGSELATILNATTDGAGYHSLALDVPLALLAGHDYYVAVRIRNASYTYPVAVDVQGSRGSGHTWLSPDGSSWVDLGSDLGCEAGIRIRTSPHAVLPADGGADPDPSQPPRSGSGFALAAPWPNPFNPSTTLAFDLDRDGPLTLCIHDLQGRLVRTLVATHLPAGHHRTRWNGRDDRGRSVPAGVYLARLDDGWRWRSRRLVLLK